MKRYIRSTTSKKAKWVKVDSYYHVYCLDGNVDLELAHISKRPSERLWTVSTDNLRSVENSINEAKRSAEGLLKQEYEQAIDWMQRCEYSEEEIQNECKTNPVLMYFGVTT